MAGTETPEQLFEDIAAWLQSGKMFVDLQGRQWRMITGPDNQKYLMIERPDPLDLHFKPPSFEDIASNLISELQKKRERFP
jgi:hypothetical protein